MSLKPPLPPNTLLDYRHVYDEGSQQTAEDGINFTGAGVTVSDDPTNHRLNVTIPGATVTLASGAEPYLAVDSLSATPRSVTDWGALINTALTAGTRRFLFGAFDYPFTTMIDGRQLQGIIFQGSGGLSWYDPGRSSANGETGHTRLIWGGTGAGFAIDFSSASTGVNGNAGPILEDLMLLYTSAAYTGKLVNYKNSTMPCIHRCFFGPAASSAAAASNNADHALELDDVNTMDVENTTFAMKALHGRGSVGGYSNVVSVRNCTFNDRAVTNPGRQWKLEHCVFEFPGLAAGDAMITTDGFAYTTGDVTGDIRLEDCYVWDAGGGTQYFVKIPASTPVQVFIERLDDTSGQGGLAKLVDHQGTGSFVMTDSTTRNIVDCGDGTSATHRKALVRVLGCAFSHTVSTALLLNTKNHDEVDIQGNSIPPAGNNLVLTDSFRSAGHERCDRASVPSVATRGGVVNISASVVSGNDGCFFMHIQNTGGVASATGLLVDVTLQNPPEGIQSTALQGKQFPLVGVTPFVADDGGNNYVSADGPASAACHLYAYAKTTRNAGSQASFSIGVGVAIPAGVIVGVRVAVRHL